MLSSLLSKSDKTSLNLSDILLTFPFLFYSESFYIRSLISVAHIIRRRKTADPRFRPSFSFFLFTSTHFLILILDEVSLLAVTCQPFGAEHHVVANAAPLTELTK